MAIRVSKSLLWGGGIFTIVLMVALAGGGFFMAWRLGQDEEVAQPPSEAAGEGDKGVCIRAERIDDIPGGDYHDYRGIHFGAYHEVIDKNTIKVCGTARNTTAGDSRYGDEGIVRTIQIWHSKDCPTRNPEKYCLRDNWVKHCQDGSEEEECQNWWGCHENSEDHYEDGFSGGRTGTGGFELEPGETRTYCRTLPIEAECGIFQWDIVVEEFPENPPGGWRYFGYLYSFGTMTCPTVETDSKCTGMSSAPAQSGGVVTVQKESDAVAITASGGDDDEAVSKIHICYAIGGQDAKYYEGGYYVHECEETLSATSESFTITHPFSYYVDKVWALGVKPPGFTEKEDVRSILFHTNIFDKPGDVAFCTSNLAYASGSLGRMLDKGGCKGSDCKDTCNLEGGNNCRITAVLEEPPQNPDWSLTKTGNVACVDEGTENVSGTVNYAITLENVGDPDSIGEVDYVEDTYDTAIQEAWIVSTDPTLANKSGGKVRWDLTGTEKQFPYDDPRTFKYSVAIPASMFGQLITNTAVAKLSTGEELSVTEDLILECGGATDDPVPPGTLPATGIFDSTATRIGLGALLIILSFAYYKSGLFDGMANWLSTTSSKYMGKARYTFGDGGKKDRWESRLVDKVDKDRS